MVEFFATKIRYACQILSLYLSLSFVPRTREQAKRKEEKEEEKVFLACYACQVASFTVSEFLLFSSRQPFFLSFPLDDSIQDLQESLYVFWAIIMFLLHLRLRVSQYCIDRFRQNPRGLSLPMWREDLESQEEVGFLVAPDFQVACALQRFCFCLYVTPRVWRHLDLEVKGFVWFSRLSFASIASNW